MRGQNIVRWILPICALAGSLQAQEAVWKIDPLHSAAHFAVRHMMISTVRGEFGGVNGIIKYDPKVPAKTTLEATIDCTTLNTGTPKRDEEMKGPEFFDVKRYPQMKFVSRKVDPAGVGKLRVTGDLTINAITKPVILDVEGPTESVKDSRGREKVGASASTKINRKEFGITWNELMETGGFALADEVTITLDIELIKSGS